MLLLQQPLLSVCCCSIEWNGNENGKLEMKQAIHIHSKLSYLAVSACVCVCVLFALQCVHNSRKIFDRRERAEKRSCVM